MICWENSAVWVLTWQAWRSLSFRSTPRVRLVACCFLGPGAFGQVEMTGVRDVQWTASGVQDNPGGRLQRVGSVRFVQLTHCWDLWRARGFLEWWRWFAEGCLVVVA